MQHHNPNFASSDFCCGSITSFLGSANDFRCAPISGQSQSGSALRFVPCVDGSELARAFFTFCSIGRCSHVFGLLTRFT
jgi:hypothetical protein